LASAPNGVTRRDDALQERLAQDCGGGVVHLVVERHDAAEGAHRVGVPGGPVGVGEGRSGCNATRARVLDHHGGRVFEFAHRVERGFEIDQVIEAELFGAAADALHGRE